MIEVETPTTRHGVSCGVELTLMVDVREDEVVAPSLRKAVVDLNETRGHPRWTLSETIDVCVRVDTIHEKRGICSTARFRANRSEERCVRAWVLACEFDWLVTAQQEA